jgi:nitrogen-specific signal transduction histidine kinase/CheY-like chemotaxis protein
MNPLPNSTDESHRREAQKLDALGTLAGGIAHDFNNLLGTIISFTEVARMDNPDNEELQNNLGEVLKASHRATTLVRQILSFSRQQPFARQRLALAPVVKEALQLLRASWPTTIRIEPNIAHDLPDVLADLNQIHQIILHLCTNAAQAMRGQTGQLQVQLAALNRKDFAVASDWELPAGDYVRLIVSDTGQGMDEPTLARAFEPFFTTKGRGEGTGLGLSVVHGIVKAHAGAITVESQPGGGTCVTVYLPALPPMEAQELAADTEIPLGRGQRILFVDDEVGLGEVAKKMIQRLGYQPRIFNHAAAAWSAVQMNPTDWDLLLSDLTMPGMSGLELAQRVLQLRPGLPVILMSGDSGPLTLAEVQAKGVGQLLNKPLNYQMLARAIHEGLRSSGQL